MALSYETTGKWTSERHEAAKREGKLTAGQAAKVVSQKLGRKVTAKELVENYKSLYGDPEWHHSGFYNGRMGRTYFFSMENIESIVRNWDEAVAKLIEKEKQEQELVFGIYYIWSREYNRYGRLVNAKVLQVYEGLLGSAPKNFKRLMTAEGFERAKKAVGKRYFGWDEPSPSEFEVNQNDCVYLQCAAN